MAAKTSRPVTMTEVANRAGVAPKTVSRVINDEPGVHAETRERILKAIEELDYRPNLNARGLASDRSFLIGLFYEKPGDYTTDFQTGAVQRCRESDLHIMVEPCDGERPEVAQHVKMLLRQLRLDAVILLPPLCDHPVILKRLEEDRVPVVRIAPRLDDVHSPVVRMDDYAAARRMTGHLVGLGHRRIGFILGRPEHGATEQRHRGFVHEMAAHGLAVDPALVLPGNFVFDDALASAEAVLSTADPPTAIFASNDDTAAAVLSVARQRRLRLPEDLSVAGFDDAPVSRMTWPPITTIRQPVAAMARAAIDLVVEHAPHRRGWPDPVPNLLLDFELIIRNSTAPPG